MKKSNLKRIVVLFLSVLLAVGLTGCTAAPSNNPKGTAAGYTSGTYTGTGTSATKTVSLGFTPKAVLVVAYQSKYDGEYNRTTVQLAVQGANAKIVSIVSGGFTVTNELNDSTSSANPYRYLALK